MATASAESTMDAAARQSEFYATVSSLDTAAFDAFNHCDAPGQLERHASYFSEDVEFYHDTGGVTWNRRDMLANTRKYVCGNFRRELVPGSLRVYPVKDFGAIAQGTHRFCQSKTGSCEGIADFAVVWRLQDGNWRMTRVLSYGHRAEAADSQSSAATVPEEVGPIADVDAFIAERELCEHFLGEPVEGSEPAQVQRRAFVRDAIDIHCAGSDRRLAALRRRFADYPEVTLRLAKYKEPIDGDVSRATVPPAPDGAWLLRGWTLSSLAPAEFNIDARFEGGRVSGMSGVNRYNGTYRTGPDNAIAIGPLASTRMAGAEPAMRAESAYLTLLGQAKSFKVSADSLVLYDGNGNESLIFEPDGRQQSH